MGLEYVELEVAGYSYGSWTTFGVSYGAKKAAPAFTCVVTDALDNAIADAWNYMPGTACKIKANGDLVLTGIIDKVNPSFDAENHTVNVDGRSKSKDTIDSSAEHPTGEMKNMDPKAIVDALNKQGVNVTISDEAKSAMRKVPMFRLNPGETVFSAVDRVLRSQDMFLTGTPDGGIKIDKGGTKRVHPALIEEQNFIGGSAVFDESDQHSDYKVKGQKVFGTDKGSLQVVQSTKNTNVKRNRPKHILPEHDVDDTSAKGRSKKHKDHQQGKSVTASIKCQGWHDANGKLWVPNTVIMIYSPRLKLYQDLLLNDVRLSHGEQGSTSQLEFVQPSSLGSDASTGSKSDKAWSDGNS